MRETTEWFYARIGQLQDDLDEAIKRNEALDAAAYQLKSMIHQLAEMVADEYSAPEFITETMEEAERIYPTASSGI